MLTLPESSRQAGLFVAAKKDDRQAFSVSWSNVHHPDHGWRIYASTDRPAYRPDQRVQWKIVVRRHAGLDYETPSGETLAYTLTGPRGDEIEKGEVTLNEFGSAWGELDTTADMALGEYHVAFTRKERNSSIGSATLFRLEEYKLPEFEVSVSTPDDPERPGESKVYVLGDEIEASEAPRLAASMMPSPPPEQTMKRRSGKPSPLDHSVRSRDSVRASS